MRTIRQSFPSEKSLHIISTEAVLRAGEKDTLMPLPRKNIHSCYLFTARVTEKLSTTLRRNRKPKVHGFPISRFIQFFCRASLTSDEWHSSETQVKVELYSKSWTIEQWIPIEISSVDLSLQSLPKSHSFELSTFSLQFYLSLKWYDSNFQCVFLPPSLMLFPSKLDRNFI